MWIDVHTHINMLELSPEETVARSQRAGVERLITIGTEPEDLPIVLALAQKFYPVVYCTLGIHPHEAEKFTPEAESFILKNGGLREVVAVGETGLDYYYKNAPLEVQKQAFRRQLEIAEELALPVEIHTRDAEADTVEILQEFRGRVKGLLHCFTGTRWLAERALDMGWNISFSGVVTFKNADELRKIVEFVPLERLHVETDAPFLTPAPHRGLKNSPDRVIHTAQKVAEIKKVSEQELAQQTRANALALFPRLIWQ